MKNWWKAALAFFAKGQGYNTVVESGLTPMSPELIRLVGGATSAAGKAVTVETASTLSAVFACFRIISESIGMLPWALYRRKGANSERADDHPLAPVLLSSPNADQTPQEFRESLGGQLAIAGNAYSFQDRLGKDVVSLYPVDAGRVVVKQKGKDSTRLAIADGEVFYSINDRGQWSDYPREKIWHVKGFGRHATVGLSPLSAAREAAGLALATEEFGARFFSQGAKPSGVITIDGWLSKEQRDVAREQIERMMGGNANAHKVVLFEGGMKPTPWGSMPLSDIEFVLTRRFNVQEIARFFRMQLHMLGDLEKGASYASIEQMSSEFVMFTLMPYLTRIESSIARWLLTPEDRAKYFVRFNYEALLRADSKARSEFYASAVQNGWMNRNEVRAKENLNSVAGLDEYTAQTSLAPVQKLAELADKAAAQPKPAAPAKDPKDEGK